MKNKDVNQAKKNIEYLEKQLKLTNLSEMQNVFYQLIEEQTKKLMLAEAQDQYIFEMIDPPVVPEEKDSPSRAIICVLGTLIGGILSIFIALIRIAVKRKMHSIDLAPKKLLEAHVCLFALFAPLSVTQWNKIFLVILFLSSLLAFSYYLITSRKFSFEK
ncbi:conserved hypothetical protein [Vibrio harveyi 1DA3]|nr:conserved hypothetical protein [Vibrio harveyi 1DA3]